MDQNAIDLLKAFGGPVVQSLTVVGIGYFTLQYQKRQARTAEKKLLSDIFKQRLTALRDFRQSLDEIVNLDFSQIDPVAVAQSKDPERNKSLQMAKLAGDEIQYLFGPEVHVHTSLLLTKAVDVLMIKYELVEIGEVESARGKAAFRRHGGEKAQYIWMCASLGV